MLVDSCSSEMICVLVYWYVTQYLFFSQDLSLLPPTTPPLGVLQGIDVKVSKTQRQRQWRFQNSCVFFPNPWVVSWGRDSNIPEWTAEVLVLDGSLEIQPTGAEPQVAL